MLFCYLWKTQRWCSPSHRLVGSSLSTFWSHTCLRGVPSLDVQAPAALLQSPRFQWKQMSTKAVFSLVAGFANLFFVFFLVSWDCG